ncbi:MAG: glycosyltransferase family 39 protein, partial [Urechidicola sp.]|nr:glycosyltransferase family 39 protein [Urechidicola sp.]
MKVQKKYLIQFILFLLLFFVINILQSKYTALFEDEAYYWVWSKNLAFGYYDHPPLVALWVKISSYFFDGELGLRFFSTISFTLMLIFIWLAIDIKEKWKFVWLYFLLIVSMVLLQVFGFITTPDTPLFLFVAVYLFAYKRFLQNDNWANSFLLGFSMAAMLYSKYHGILVILFTVLSNISLLRKKKFWAASFFGFLLFLPHLYWQYANGFPSFVFHLKERYKRPYKIDNTFMHFINIIAIVGITFPVIFNAFFKQNKTTTFYRSLNYIVYGVFIFFFFSTFNSTTQAQWLGVLLIPLVLLTFPYFIQHQKARKWLIILGSIQFGLLLITRVFLANENISPIQLEPHVSKTWVPTLKDKTEGKPIVFINSYRNASIYTFYTGIKSHSYSVLDGRKSQYDFLDFEKTMQHENVYSASKHLLNDSLLVKKEKNFLKGRSIQNYTTFQKVKCTINNPYFTITLGKKNDFKFTFINTYDKNIDFKNVKFIGVFQGYRNKILARVSLQINNLSDLKAFETKVFEATSVSYTHLTLP